MSVKRGVGGAEDAAADKLFPARRSWALMARACSTSHHHRPCLSMNFLRERLRRATMVEGSYPDAPEIRLDPHPTGRSEAIARRSLAAGTVVATSSSLSTCLLPSEKGQRCDECHVHKSDTLSLMRCSRCASFWYCGTSCRRKHNPINYPLKT